MTYHCGARTGVQGHQSAILNTMCLSYGVHLETIIEYEGQVAPGKIGGDVPGKRTRDIRIVVFGSAILWPVIIV